MPVQRENDYHNGQDVSIFQGSTERVMLWDLPESILKATEIELEFLPLRILLAEDNMIAQAAIRGLLVRKGIEVVVAANGREAVELFGSGRYDLVMLDILMPDMDGFEVASMIREKERLDGTGQTPVIALTAYSLKAVKDKCRSVSMNGYMSKPVSDNDLIVLFSWLRELGGHHQVGTIPSDGNDRLTLLDVAGSLENLGQDLDLYREIVDMFMKSAPEIVQGLIDALVTGDLVLAEQSAHNLKGMAANIGAQRLADRARVIQNSVRTTENTSRQEWIRCLPDELASLMAALATYGETGEQ